MAYTVGEMAKMLHVAPSTLRYYDKEGLLPFVERSSGGIRLFKDSDFEWLSIIECMKQTGMPIKEIKTFIDLCMAGDSTISERLNLIRRQQEAVRAQMAQLQSTLDMLDYKEWYTAPHSKRAPAPFMRRFRRRKFPRSSVPFASEPRAQGKSKRSDTKLSAKN